MKTQLPPFPKRAPSAAAACVAAACLLFGNAFLAAEDLSYDDLKKAIAFDRKKIEADDGAVFSYADSLEKVMPTVVTVYSNKTVQPQRNARQEELFRRMFPTIPEDYFDQHGGGGQPRTEQGLGSGVIITGDGYILTNNHVVAGADEVLVALASDKREYAAKVVGADPRTDVALIKIDAEGLPAITVGDSSKLRVGDVAIAVGNPLGLEQTATVGIVSALGRNDLNITGGGFENFIQTDASINRGNSGGALVDARGRLIGLNTAIQSGMSGGNIGIGFAIPSNMALNIVERLLDGGGVVHRGFLGVYLDEMNENFAKAYGRENLNGAVVVEVGPDTPADKAGFRSTDLIVGYNGKEVESVQKLRLDISNTEPGTEVEFTVLRGGKERSIPVVLGDLEELEDSMPLAARGPRAVPLEEEPDELLEGVTVSDLDEEVRAAMELDEGVQGVVVESVDADSPAAEAGLRAGTVITMIDQQDVASKKDAEKIVEKFEGEVLLLQVKGRGRVDILAIEME